MKIRLKVFLLFIFFFMSINFTYAAITCCFDGDVFGASASGCSEGEIDVGQILQVGSELCDFSSKRQVCEYNLDNIVYCNFMGNEIYDFDWYSGFILQQTGLNIDDYCVLKPYVSSCINSDPIGSVNPNFDDTDSITGSIVGDSSDVSIPDDTELLEILDAELRKFCYDTGGPFGFFLNEFSCNNLIDQNGNNPCLYNPYHAGEISISIAESTIGLGNMEEGCIPKTSIDKCLDYKTQINCENNIVGGSEFSTNDLALKNCVWIPTNSFLDSDIYFEVDSGICISNATEEDKNYDLSQFVDRGNLLINPSFELYLDNSWNGLDKIEGIENAFNGYNYAKILPGTVLSQEVLNLGERVSYETLLYIMTNQSFSEGDEVVVTITEFYSNGFDVNEFSIDLSSFNSSEGIFEKYIIPNNYVVSEGTLGINFDISSTVLIYVDAIYFGVDDVKFTTGNNGLFEPLEIIPSQASSCELCFDDRNFNFCTQEKSDLLGDCSYMVDNLSQEYMSELGDDYLGSGGAEGGNPYLGNFSSQSLANSLIFCELYVTEDSCENPNNFLNSVVDYNHFESGPNLCKWNPSYGCFKDSDNSNGPDTILNGQIYHKKVGVSYDEFGDEFFNEAFYNRTSLSSLPSDFELGCDYLPPESYISFEAQYENLSKVYVTNSFPDEVIGNVIIDAKAYDLDLESCSPFDVEKNIWIDYEVTNSKTSSWFRKVQGSVFNQKALIQDFFVNNTETILEEGVNTFSITIRDQSGNVAKVRNFDFDVDLYGPKIVLNDVSLGGIYGPYGPDSKLSFNIFDAKSGVVNCSYNLDANGDIDLTYYNFTGDFLDFASPKTYVDNQNFMFDLPIYNTSLSGDFYVLTVSCQDVFKQVATESYIIGVDFDTSFILISPQDLYGLDQPYLVSDGFINTAQDFWAISADTGMDTDACSFDFTGTEGGSGSLSSQVILEPIDLPGYGFDIYTNITGSFDFSSDGIKDFKAKCVDVNGNEYEENLRYYYDTALPVFDSWSMIDVSLNNNTVVLIDDKYYTREEDRFDLTLKNILNLSIDGTLSWMSDDDSDYNLSIWNGSSYVDVSSERYGIDLKNDSTVADVYIGNYVDLSNYNIETLDDRLFERKHKIGFRDMAGNVAEEEFSYYFDNSMPNFVFGGDIFKNGDLYTGVSDPQFEVSFNTPDYRTWDCDIDVVHEGLTFIANYDNVKNLDFTISEIIGSNFEFNADATLDIDFICFDIYGVSLSHTYTLKYDNTSPILDSVYLDGGNNIYLANAGNNVVYNAIVDKLVFDFQDTGEEGYSCEYSFENYAEQSYYTCDDNVSKTDFEVRSENLLFKTGDLNILDENMESICLRDKVVISPILETLRLKEKSLYSKIKVSGECFDRVNLSTGNYSFDVNVNYVAGNKFVDFNIEYNLISAKLIARSMTPFDHVVVSFDDNGNDVLTELSLTGEEDGLFIYSSNVDISGIDEGFSPMTLFAVGFGSDSSIWDRITTKLVIDRISPVIDLNFPDANADGEVFFKDFQILFDVFDDGGSSIHDVDLYLNDQLIYRANNISEYDSDNLYEPDVTRNHYSIDMSNYFGSVIFANGVIGGVYDFRVVAKDGFGNEASVNRTIEVLDGVGIRLIDSVSALVDFDRFSWITKSNAPILSFETSKAVKSCKVSPLFDNVWMSLYSESEVRENMIISGFDISEFNFDLSDFEIPFDLSQVDQKDFDIFIQCSNGTQIFNFTRTLSMINTLPDYVLSSSEGFLINNEPFETNLNVLSVGPYKYITCEYSIDNSPFMEFGEGLSYRFVENLNFDNYAAGTYELDLRCSDKLGTQGPLKTYDFIINPFIATTIVDIQLTNGALNYELVDDTFYVDSLDGFGLEFKANKNDLSCSYDVDKYIGNPLTSLLTYFMNLFVDNSEELVSTSNPYIYMVNSGLSFSDGGVNKLSIVCGTDSFTYDVLYVENSDFDFDLNKIN